MKKPTVYSGATCTCTDCGRVLWVEDGPTCEDCLIARAMADVENRRVQPDADAIEPRQPDVPKLAPKKRGGCCGSS